MGTYKQVVLALRDEVDDCGTVYVKSKKIAEALSLTSREVGCVFSDLRDDDAPITVEEWSRSSGSRVWAVQIEDKSELSRFLSMRQSVSGRCS